LADKKLYLYIKTDTIDILSILYLAGCFTAFNQCCVAAETRAESFWRSRNAMLLRPQRFWPQPWCSLHIDLKKPLKLNQFEFHKTAGKRNLNHHVHFSSFGKFWLDIAAGAGAASKFLPGAESKFLPGAA
jgi:hypothetical protein